MPETTDRPLLGHRFDVALVYVARLHRRQVRKGSEVPYLSHLLGVASLVLEDGGDEDEAIAALLHDAAEDQGGQATLDAIRDEFGDRVAAIVEENTDSDPALADKPPWRERKTAYLASIPHKSPSGVRVSLADKLHNARAIARDHRELGDAVWTRFNAGRDDQLWYLRGLADAFLEVAEGPLARDLDDTVRTLERTT